MSSEPFSCAAIEQDCTLDLVIQIFNGSYDAGVGVVFALSCPYAPTSSYDDSEVDEFYRELQSLVDQTPKQDILVVQCDWNTKV